MTADSDRRCFLEMVDLMPPVCRAVRPAQTEGERPRHARSARSLLQNFLDTVTDATIRTGLAEAGFPERGRGGRARSSLPGGPVSSWLRSLAWIEDRIELGTQPVEDFAIELRLWNRGVVDPEAGSVHLHLDLEVPESDDPAVEWTLSFHLRASEDPSTSIPAETVSGGAEGALRRGSRQVPHAQERLLLELARAARVVPAIGRALEARSPTEAKLTLVEAYDLLAEGSAAAGSARHLLPATRLVEGAPERPRYLLYLRPAEEADGSASMEPGTETEEPENRSGTLLAYDWKVALGDAHLTPEEFHALAQAQRPLVRIEGNWIEVRPEDAEALGRILLKERKAHPTLSLPEALRLGLGGLSGPHRGPASGGACRRVGRASARSPGRTRRA
ncbi:MAG: SNF2 helicase-associated domain-containing protein [Candidatus Eisenbacteria bacterium]